MKMSPRARTGLGAAACAALLAITLTACADDAAAPLDPGPELEATVLPITDAQLAGTTPLVW